MAAAMLVMPYAMMTASVARAPLQPYTSDGLLVNGAKAAAIKRPMTMLTPSAQYGELCLGCIAASRAGSLSSRPSENRTRAAPSALARAQANVLIAAPALSTIENQLPMKP